MGNTSNKYILNHIQSVNGVFTDLGWMYAKAASASAYKAEFGNFINKKSSLGVAVPVQGEDNWVMVGVSDIDVSDSSKTASYALSLLTALNLSKIKRSDGISLIFTELSDGVIHALCLRGNIIMLDMVVNPLNNDDAYELIAFVSDSTISTDNEVANLEIINLVASTKQSIDEFFKKIIDVVEENQATCKVSQYEIDYDDFFSVLTKKNIVYIKDVKQFSSLRKLSKKKLIVGAIGLSLVVYMFMGGEEEVKIDPFAEALKIQQQLNKKRPAPKKVPLEATQKENVQNFQRKKRALLKAENSEINSLINKDSILDWKVITRSIRKTPIEVEGWKSNFINMYPNQSGNYDYRVGFVREDDSKTILHLKKKYPTIVSSLIGDNASLKREVFIPKKKGGFDISSNPKIDMDLLKSRLQSAKNKKEITSWNLSQTDNFSKKNINTQEIINLFSVYEDKGLSETEWVTPVKRYKLTAQGNSTNTIGVITKILASVYNNNLQMVTYDINTNRLTMEIYLYEIQ